MIEFEEFNESADKETGPDLTPLIDMVFLLLIFFLLTSFFARPSIHVDLPRASEAEVAERQDVTITIEKGGAIMLNGEHLRPMKLEETLEWIYLSTDAKEAVIQSDREVPFGTVVEVMDIAKRAGAEGISFLVEHPE